jgi:quercetin dioxygenase-like cupin family protein
MSPLDPQPINRRGFLTAMAATSAAVGAFALSIRAASAAQDANSPTTTAQPTNPFAGGITRTEVQRATSSIPGREIVQVLTQIPAGVASGWHTHPGEEVGYILAGTVEMMVEGQRTRTLNAGDGFLIPPMTPHNAFDVGPEVGQMLSTYIVEETEPLVTLIG